MGDFFGKLLSERNYNWVSHYPKLQDTLKKMFPSLSVSSAQEHMDDIKFVMSAANSLSDDFLQYRNMDHNNIGRFQ